MNYLKTTLLILIISTLSLSGLHAQNIDQERMQRDINIMEGVLGELFKTCWGARGSYVKVVSPQLTFNNSSEISGTYLEDYGVLFTIPGGAPAVVLMSDAKDQVSAYRFKYGDEDEVTEETINKRISEFLRDYGSTINQLNDNEHVTVIYGSTGWGQSNKISQFSLSGSRIKKQMLPTISITAKKADLEAYRKERINKSQLNDRLSITTNNNDESDNRDLKVMANILETTFEDADRDQFKVRGSINHLYINDLGALFNIKTSQGSGLSISQLDPNVMWKRLAKNDSTSNIPVSDKLEKLEQNKKESYKNFIAQLKKTLVDYGRTLKSVQSDELILVSVSISNSGDNLPEKVDIQLKKSVLEAYDKGNMSREQAMEQITVREY